MSEFTLKESIIGWTIITLIAMYIVYAIYLTITASIENGNITEELCESLNMTVHSNYRCVDERGEIHRFDSSKIISMMEDDG